MKPLTKIPVTIISGFLGAGKTTFINQLLRKYPDTQFALVENEFGEVAIDSHLIKGVDASKMFELKNGCICCTIFDEFELVLKELAEKFPDIGHLLIETTGLADPTSIIQPFYKDEGLKKTYSFQGLACLVDGKNFNQYIGQDVAAKQIAMADLVILNKSSEIGQGHKKVILADLKKRNPLAPILQVNFGDVSQFNLEELEVVNKSNLYFMQRPKSIKTISSKALQFETLPTKEQFEQWLEYILDIYKKEIYRVKGVMYFRDEPYEYIVQGVGGSFEVTEGGVWFENKPGQLVFIGYLQGIFLEYPY